MLVNAYKDALIPDWQRPPDSVLTKTEVDDVEPTVSSLPGSTGATDVMIPGANSDVIDAVLSKVCPCLEHWAQACVLPVSVAAPAERRACSNKHAS
eukprot:3934968-Rhodomonas_salina.1